MTYSYQSLTELLQLITTCTNAAFNWGVTIWSSVGISLVTLIFVIYMMIFVKKYLKSSGL